MKLLKKDYIVIQKRMIELDLVPNKISKIIGYKTDKGLTDTLSLAKKNKGVISEDKVKKLEEILEIEIGGLPMSDLDYKFLIEIFEGEIEYEGKKYKNLVNKIGCFKLSEAKKIKQAMIEEHPDKEIIVKEKFRDGWREVNI